MIIKNKHNEIYIEMTPFNVENSINYKSKRNYNSIRNIIIEQIFNNKSD